MTTQKNGTSGRRPYYTSNLDRFVSAFDKVRRALVDRISKQSTAETANVISHDAALNFERILPELPYVGGDAHPGTRFILIAGQWIAVYKAMAKSGYRAIDVGQMLYSIYEEQLKDVPVDELEKQKEFLFSDVYRDMMKHWAESRSPYECDWKVDFIEGDGVDFDYGLDFRSCPCFDFFKAQNVEELAPFLCLLDFPEAALLESGLVRTKTLAQKDAVCNFRYKKGREVVQNWESEVKKILKNN